MPRWRAPAFEEFDIGPLLSVAGLARFLKQQGQGQKAVSSSGSMLMTAMSHAILYLSFRLGTSWMRFWWRYFWVNQQIRRWIRMIFGKWAVFWAKRWSFDPRQFIVRRWSCLLRNLIVLYYSLQMYCNNLQYKIGSNMFHTKWPDRIQETTANTSKISENTCRYFSSYWSCLFWSEVTCRRKVDSHWGFFSLLELFLLISTSPF